MSVRAIEAEVSIKSGVQAECTIGREVPYYIDRPIYDGDIEITPEDNDIILPTEGLAINSNILIHGVQKIKTSGSFIKSGSGTTYTLHVGRNDWTHLVVYPHTLPYTQATSALSRAIGVKYVDLEIGVMISSYMSNAGNAWNAGSLRYIDRSDDISIEDDGEAVKFSGSQAEVGRWINDVQYDYFAW